MTHPILHHTNNLAEVLAARHAKVDSQADKPIGADSSEKDLMPLCGHLFRRGEFDRLLLVCPGVKDSTVPSEERDNEKRSCQIAPEGDDPMSQHLDNAESSLIDCHGGKLSIRCQHVVSVWVRYCYIP